MFAKKIIFLAVFFLFLTAFAADAHRLNVFAWLDNDRIIVRCNFGKDRPVLDAKVNVYDNATHKMLLQGITDRQGVYSFLAPDIIRQGHSLLITVDGGQGHKGEWLMEASELYAAASVKAGFDSARLKEPSMRANAASESAENIELPGGGGLNEEKLRKIIKEENAPIHARLAELSNKGPGLAEIVGGIGWIIGLAGIGMYFMARNKNK